MITHTTTGSLADALRALADRLDQLGSIPIAATYLDVNMQTAQSYAPIDARRRAVDVLAATLDLGMPEERQTSGLYGTRVGGCDVAGATVHAYTGLSTKLDPYAGVPARAARVG